MLVEGDVALSNGQRRKVCAQIDDAFYKLMNLVSKWQLADDFLTNTSDPDVAQDLKELHRRLAQLSNQFDEIKQRTVL